MPRGKSGGHVIRRRAHRRRPTARQVDVDRPDTQIVLRVTAALPGDEAYGHLAATCSEDLLNALVGIFTDMLTLGRLLGRPVVYTPLPICSVYAGVNGAIAVGAALADRERSGKGREIIASRLAGGLSAIGALTLTSSGIPPHLAPVRSLGLPEGLTAEQFQDIVREAARNPAKQLWLAQRFSPLASPFKSADGRLILPMVSREPPSHGAPAEGAERVGRRAGRGHGERIVLRPGRRSVRRPQPR